MTTSRNERDDVWSLRTFHDHLNSQHPAIQFTMEEESEGQIPFLDTLVRKEGAEVKISVYWKPTATDRYMYIHFDLHHQRKTPREL